MARPPLATIEDLESALGDEIPDDDTTKTESLLDRASAIVRAFAGRTWLNDAGDTLEDVPDDIPGVVVGMVIRAIDNPTGVTSSQEVAGPFARQFSFGSAAAERLYLTSMDKLVIRAAVGVSALLAISMTRGPVEMAGPPSCVLDDDLTEIA